MFVYSTKCAIPFAIKGNAPKILSGNWRDKWAQKLFACIGTYEEIVWSVSCSLWTVCCFQASCIDHCSNVQKLLALTTQPKVESKILFFAQYSYPYAKEVVGLDFISLSLRCLKDINTVQSKVDHLKVDTYQLDRSIILTILNASVWMQRDFGYPVLIQTSKFSYFILELVPT